MDGVFIDFSRQSRADDLRKRRKVFFEQYFVPLAGIGRGIGALMVVRTSFERDDDHVRARSFDFGERSGAGTGYDQIGERVRSCQIGLRKEIMADDVGKAGKLQAHGSVEFSENDFEIDSGDFFRRFENRFENPGRTEASADSQHSAFCERGRIEPPPGNARIEQLS